MTDDIAKIAAVQTQVLALELSITDSAKKEIIQKHLVAMLAMERERCALIVETASTWPEPNDIAEAIRRGDE